MKKRDLVIIFVLELAVIGVVTLLFRLIPSKAEASIGASLAFIFVGVWINIAALRWPKFYQSLTFWAAQIHLFFSAIPLMVYRILNFNTGFDQIQIFGIPGPDFHIIATRIYGALLLATLADIALLTLRARKTS